MADLEPPRARVMTELRRRDFVAFLAKVFETVSSADSLHLNWHLYAVSWQLQQIERGLSTRLVVTMPPRNLKSITISVAWVAWLLGQRPSLRIICVSYAEGLALDAANKCKTVMQSEWYRQTFPNTVLRGRAPTLDFRTTLTGRGGDIIIIDDPIKPDDAYSPVIRQSCLDWYANTLTSRLNNKKLGAMVLIIQRLHAEDLAGHVLAEGGWAHLNLPAIATKPDRVQIGRELLYQRSVGVPLNPPFEDLAELLRQQRIMGSMNFSAQYQQAPIPAGGLMVKDVWLRYYDAPPTRLPDDKVVQCWDTASNNGSTNDYSVCVTALIRGREVYILHVYRGRLQFPALLAKVQQLGRDWQIDALLIEEAASGIQLIQSLRSLPGLDLPSPIPRPTTTSKETGLWGQTARIEAGDLRLPTSAPWLDEFRAELLGFPKERHDDQVDALVHLLAWPGVRRRPPPLNGIPELFDANTPWEEPGEPFACPW